VATSEDIRLFLSSRRARLTPARAGLPMYGRQRRVPGLRREEVALLAGISVDYYTRIERGNAQGVSKEVLDAIAGALKLTVDERLHLENLVRAADAAGAALGAAAPDEVRLSIRRIVDGMTTMPALVRNRRLEILHANPLGRALYGEVFEDRDHAPNPVRYVFLDRRSHEFFVDWDRAVDDMVGLLRAETGRSPGDTALAGLVDELTSHSGQVAHIAGPRDSLSALDGLDGNLALLVSTSAPSWPWSRTRKSSMPTVDCSCRRHTRGRVPCRLVTRPVGQSTVTSPSSRNARPGRACGQPCSLAARPKQGIPRRTSPRCVQ